MIDPTRAAATLLILSCLLLGACNAQNMAFVGSDNTSQVAAFKPGTNALRGSITIPNTPSTDHSLLLRADGQIGYVRGAAGTIHAVDLTTSPPTLQAPPTRLSNTVDDMAGVNLLMIVSAGRDTTVGGNDALVSSALPAAQQEIDVLNLGPGHSAAIDVCDNDSTVLVALRGSNRAVRKLTISSDGQLTDTGLSFRPSHPPANIHCAPGSQSGIVVASVGATAQTFTTRNLAVVDTQQLAAYDSGGFDGFGHSAAFNTAGDAVFVMSSVGDFTGRGYVERFNFNPATGVLGSRLQTTVEPVTHTTQGIELLDVGPNDQHVYVTEWSNDRIRVLDAATLTQQRTLSGLNAPIAIDVEGDA